MSEKHATSKADGGPIGEGAARILGIDMSGVPRNIIRCESVFSNEAKIDKGNNNERRDEDSTPERSMRRDSTDHDNV